jgi:hypothetical protein
LHSPSQSTGLAARRLVDVDQLVAQPGEDHPPDEADALGRVEDVGIFLQGDAQRAGGGRAGENYGGDE